MGVLVKNGKSYTGTGDLLIQPVIYSDDERCIGVWRDGKPLYQKSFNITAGSASTYNTYLTDVENVENVVYTYGFFIENSNLFYNFSSYDGNASIKSTGLNFFVNAIDNKIRFDFRNGTEVAGLPMYITVQYTKTTDTAGTAAWVPTGATPIHYSLNEQVIGTWIDGKPLYQKTVVFDSEITLSNTTWNDLPKTDDIYNIVDSLVMAIGHGASENSQCGITRNLEVSCDSSTNYLKAITVRAGNDYLSAVTLQYTKTTD